MADQDGRTLAGVFPVMATPFDENGALDMAGLGRLVAFELDAGAHGLTILGNMGEVFKLSENERATVTAGVMDAVAGRAPVVVGIGPATTHLAAHYARVAQAQGADALLVPPPRQPGLSDEALLHHYTAVAEAVAIPLVVQDDPSSTGVVMSPALLASITEVVPPARYIKLEEAPTPLKIGRVRALGARDAGIFGGAGGLYCLEELDRGACGIMTGFAYPEILVQIYMAHRRGDHAEAARIFDHALPLIRFEAQPAIGLAIRKHLLRLRGALATAYVRPPAPAIDGATVEELRAIVQRLGLPLDGPNR